MPVKYSNYPPEWKAVSRAIRFTRSGKRCERCNVRQYAVGYWKDDAFHYEKGNAYWDQFMYADSYKEAREACDEVNDWQEGEPKRIVIVLTVAHQCQCEPLCANPDHLLALCQRCHLRQDLPLHMANAARTRREKKDAARSLLTI